MSETITLVTFPTRIGVVTDNESSRFALGSVKIEGNAERVWASATDGRCAASVLCKGHTDESRLVPAELVPSTKKAMRDGSAEVERNGQWENRAGKAVSQDVEGRFPYVQEHYPEVYKDAICLTIDPTLLMKVATALTRDGDFQDRGVTLFIRPPREGSQVDTGVAVLGAEGIGCVMPLRADDSVKQYREKYSDFRRANRGE